MLNIIISGCCGYMGNVVSAIADSDPEISVAAGFDIAADKPCGYPVFANPAEFTGSAGAVVDFSAPSALDGLLSYCVSKHIPVVLCTTGYDREQLAAIESASKLIPVFRSGNMSLGINLLADLVRRACSVLGADYDVEIIESHHRRKVDAPSGTAAMLADAAADSLPYSPEYVFERQSKRAPRAANEIGVHSVRGGTIIGEHEVILAGTDEVISLKHSAASRSVFAVGAIKAAKFMASVEKPGIYDMSDVLGSRKS